MIRKVAVRQTVNGGHARTAADAASPARAVRAPRDRRRDDLPARPPAAVDARRGEQHRSRARASQLRRRLRGAGYQLHGNLLEVSPAATIAALCGPRAARGYKRDADPWVTRAQVLEQLRDLAFAPQSRMAREDVLQNDHCFDAVISAYTAYLWARDGWAAADGVFADDGWIVAPP